MPYSLDIYEHMPAQTSANVQRTVICAYVYKSNAQTLCTAQFFVHINENQTNHTVLLRQQLLGHQTFRAVLNVRYSSKQFIAHVNKVTTL